MLELKQNHWNVPILMYNPAKPYKYKILKLIERTWKTPYVRVERGVYPVVFKKLSFPEVDHTDGIGTKGSYHWRQGTFKEAVIDALAMNLNDLALVRAVPYKLSNHITVPVEDERVYEIIKALVAECRKRRIAVVGGENSFHNNSDGLDISMTVSGFVKKTTPNMCCTGDVLIGLKSGGLHSNGFSTVRKIFGKNYRDEFTEPTRIYIDDILSMLDKCKVNGMMHITGGAFTKLKDILNKSDAVIFHPKKLQPQKIFQDMFTKGIANKEMYSTFNCGIGFVLSAPKKEVSNVLSCFRSSDAEVIGEIKKGKGMVHITSAFNRRIVRL